MSEERVTYPRETMVSEPIEGFTTIETGTVAIYHSLYDRIFWDLDQAETGLSGERIDFSDLIHAAAHLRLVIEGVTMASFVASHVLFSRADCSAKSSKNYDAMKKAVEKLNANYWPRAFGPVVHQGQQGIGVRPGVGLSESEVGPFFGTVSELLHVHNPFAKQGPAPEEYSRRMDELIKKFHDLLDSHIVQLADSSETIYLRRLNGVIRVQALATERPLL